MLISIYARIRLPTRLDLANLLIFLIAAVAKIIAEGVYTFLSSLTLEMLINLLGTSLIFWVGSYVLDLFRIKTTTVLSGPFRTIAYVYKFVKYIATDVSFREKLDSLFVQPVKADIARTDIVPIPDSRPRSRSIESIDSVEPQSGNLKFEGACASSLVAVPEKSLPPSVGELYVDFPEKGKTFVGHFVTHEKYYVMNHHTTVGHDEVWLKGHRKDGNLSMVKIVARDVSNDLAYAEKGTTQAYLSLKTVQFALPRYNKPCSLYTVRDTQILKQYPKIESWKRPRGFCIATKSNTTEGDCGLPIMQDGKVVALHSLFDKENQVNVHVVPFRLLMKDVYKEISKTNEILRKKPLPQTIVDYVHYYESSVADDDERLSDEDKKILRRIARDYGLDYGEISGEWEDHGEEYMDDQLRQNTKFREQYRMSGARDPIEFYAMLNAGMVWDGYEYTDPWNVRNNYYEGTNQPLNSEGQMRTPLPSQKTTETLQGTPNLAQATPPTPVQSGVREQSQGQQEPSISSQPSRKKAKKDPLKPETIQLQSVLLTILKNSNLDSRQTSLLFNGLQKELKSSGNALPTTLTEAKPELNSGAPPTSNPTNDQCELSSNLVQHQ